MSPKLLRYYEELEKASVDMLEAAQAGDWDQVTKLEGDCLVLIGQLKQAVRSRTLSLEEAAVKALIMRRILQNDAEIRTLAEPHLQELERLMAQGALTLH